MHSPDLLLLLLDVLLIAITLRYNLRKKFNRRKQKYPRKRCQLRIINHKNRNFKNSVKYFSKCLENNAFGGNRTKFYAKSLTIQKKSIMSACIYHINVLLNRTLKDLTLKFTNEVQRALKNNPDRHNNC